MWGNSSQFPDALPLIALMYFRSKTASSLHLTWMEFNIQCWDFTPFGQVFKWFPTPLLSPSSKVFQKKMFCSIKYCITLTVHLCQGEYICSLKVLVSWRLTREEWLVFLSWCFPGNLATCLQSEMRKLSDTYINISS